MLSLLAQVVDGRDRADDPVPTRAERHERIAAHLRGRGWMPVADLSRWIVLEIGIGTKVLDKDLRHLCLIGRLHRRPTRGAPGAYIRAYEYSLNAAWTADGARSAPDVLESSRRATVRPSGGADSAADLGREAVVAVLLREPERLLTRRQLRAALPHLGRGTLDARLAELEEAGRITVDRDERPLLFGMLS